MCTHLPEAKFEIVQFGVNLTRIKNLFFGIAKKIELGKKILMYRKNSKIWNNSNNCQNCPKNRNV